MGKDDIAALLKKQNKGKAMLIKAHRNIRTSKSTGI
jgi:hypothetical protein